MNRRLAALVDGYDDEYGGRSQRGQDRLGLWCGHNVDPNAARAENPVKIEIWQLAPRACAHSSMPRRRRFIVCATAAQRLRDAGFTELAETDSWTATANGESGLRGKFFTVRAGSLVAWNTERTQPDAPFRVVGGHTDSPNLRVKQHPDRVVAGWQVVALQPYGGAWLNSWLDRDLGISGRLSVRRDSTIEHLLVRIDDPILRVPQLAIHLSEDRKGVVPIRSVTSMRCGAWANGPVRSCGSSPSGPASMSATCWVST